MLEKVGRTFLTGYAFAAEARVPSDVAKRVEVEISRSFRGFAYEGAAMGFAIRDGLPFGRSDNVARFLADRGDAHVYMTYVGVGWAMARLPRFRWSTLTAPDPLLRWLVLDGYGFHQAYFHTRRYVHQQYEESRFPWPADDPDRYANRVIDQGIGRATWFVGGADVRWVTDMFAKFPERRRADLYAGAGLAATYASGASEADLQAFWRDAGEYRPNLAQGSAFAAGARVRAGLVAPHNELGTQVLCGLSPADAAEVTDKVLPEQPYSGVLPAYELWRRRIADELMSMGRY